MKTCNDPYGEERKGQDAARWGERHDYEHRERMREARWEPDSCDAHYARGYKREIEHQNKVREEVREEEELQSRRDEERLKQWAREESLAEDGWRDEEETLRLAEEMNDDEDELERLKVDQQDWRKGVQLIASAVGIDTLSCVDIAAAALKMRAEKDQVRDVVEAARPYLIAPRIRTKTERDRHNKLKAALAPFDGADDA